MNDRACPSHNACVDAIVSDEPAGEAVQWATALQLLVRVGLLSHRELGTSEIEVTPLVGRNENVMVSLDKQARFVVRRCPVDQEVLAPSAEAGLLDFLQHEKYLRVAVPRCAYNSDAENCIVFDYVRHSENMRLYWARTRNLPTYHCRNLGTLLSTLHRTAVPPSRRSFWRAACPSILKLRVPQASHYLDSSPAILQTIHLLQHSACLQEALAQLDERWEPTHLCHNDVRSENVLLTRSAPNARVSGLVLIDWELAGFGDPAWDVAGILSEYAAYWINTIPTASQFPPNHFLPWAQFRVDRVRQLASGFWNAYRKPWEVLQDAKSLDTLLGKALSFVPARLVQTAVERGRQRAAVDLTTGMLLQLSENLMRKPDLAKTMFFGLGARASLPVTRS